MICPNCRRFYKATKARSIGCVCGTRFTADSAGKVCAYVKVPQPPAGGPGTELSLMFVELGIKPSKTCGCDEKAEQMNLWGAAGCRAHRAEIAAWLTDAIHSTPLSQLARAALAAVFQGKPLTVDCMIDAAIERAEKKGTGVRPLRVAFISPGMQMGGAERWIASLCEHFDRRKIWPGAVAVVDFAHASPAARAWFPAIPIAPIEALAAIEAQVDMLISWGPVGLDKLTKKSSIPIVDVQHGTLGHWEGSDRDGFKVQEIIAREAIAAGAHLAAVNEECLWNYPSSERHRVKIIPNGAERSRVESKLTKQEARAMFGIPPECANVVLFIGRFAREKNLQAIVDALEFLPGWTLLAAGPQYNMPKNTDGKMIVMPGVVDPPADLYRAADVLCMPSFHEAHSLTLCEANLAGLPVVSYDYPAMKHLTAKHPPGLALLVPVRTPPSDLAVAIFAAGANYPDGARIKAVAAEHYTAEAMARRWESYILPLAGENVKLRPYGPA